MKSTSVGVAHSEIRYDVSPVARVMTAIGRTSV